MMREEMKMHFFILKAKQALFNEKCLLLSVDKYNCDMYTNTSSNVGSICYVCQLYPHFVWLYISPFL